MAAQVKLSKVSKYYKLYSKPIDRLKDYIWKGKHSELIEAIKSVDLEIKSGQAVGFIGDNGAGKSTLLQIIAGVTQPSKGTVKVNGRVASILELGCGFHSDFTGKENVFFYGELLGIPAKRIRQKITEIREFAELGPFFDKPIKTYSSGMMTRLAFSVITLLDVDLIIIDEALSVGDLYFQSKCSKKILELKKTGKTILFCSHSMYQVSLFCDHVVWLHKGKIKQQGTPDEIIPRYEFWQRKKQEERAEEKHRDGLNNKKSLPVISSFRLISNKDQLRFRGKLLFEIKVKSSDHTVPYHVTLSIKMDDGRGLYITGTNFKGLPPIKGIKTIRIEFPEINLLGGIYIAHARILDETASVMWGEKSFNFKIKKTINDLGSCYMDHKFMVIE